MQVVHHLCQRARQGGPGQLQRVLCAKNNNSATALVTAGSFGQPEVLQALLEYCSYEDMYGEAVMSKSGVLQQAGLLIWCVAVCSGTAGMH